MPNIAPFGANAAAWRQAGRGGMTSPAPELSFWTLERAMAIDNHSQILLVDDSGTVRKVVRELLRQIGFKKVDEASDGEAAIAKIAEKKYDLVIADWHMEPMNGQDLLEKIRENEHNKNLHFIMMTGETAIDKIIQARDAGVSGFINKPFNAGALRAKIAQIG